MSDEHLRYADDICRIAEVGALELHDAFARVPREHFLGPGPWMIAQPFDPANPYRRSDSAEPSCILQDVVVGIELKRQLNNGQPSAHARWIASVLPKPGETVMHVGAGVGYFSAILAELVGPTGRVVAVEADAELTARARPLLSKWPWVSVDCSEARAPAGPLDVLYVNAGATYARPEWLDALARGGRLLLPLTVHLPGFPHGVGAVFRFERRGDAWSARFVSPVGIFDCLGARDEKHEPRLRKLLDFAVAAKATAMTRAVHVEGASCIVHLDGFCLRSEG